MILGVSASKSFFVRRNKAEGSLGCVVVQRSLSVINEMTELVTIFDRVHQCEMQGIFRRRSSLWLSGARE